MTNDSRALELYQFALSLAETKGRFVTVGLLTYREFRTGGITIMYIPSSGHLDIWQGRKVLTINRRPEGLKVSRYSPGAWEKELETALGTVT